jgi:hypothetical protein
MPYALFENDDKLSRTFPTEADVWLCAEEAGLVIDVPTKTGTNRVLEDHYVIKSCPAERDAHGADWIFPPHGMNLDEP